MAIEMWGPDADGHLALMESPDPDAASPMGTATSQPEPAREPEPPAPAPEPSQTDELRALRRMAEEQRQEAARQAGQMETVTKLLRGEDLLPPAEAKPAARVRPKSEDFATWDEHVEALTEWKAEQKSEEKVAGLRQELQQKEQQAEQERQRAALQAQILAGEAAMTEAHADYLDVVTHGFAAHTPPAFRNFFMHVLGPHAAAVGYHVAHDTALVQRLVDMPPETLRSALWQLKAVVVGPDESVSGAVTGTGAAQAAGELPPAAVPPQAPRVSAGVGGNGGRQGPPLPARVPPSGRAKPAPPRPLGGGSSTVAGGYRDDMSQSEYRAYRAAGGL